MYTYVHIHTDFYPLETCNLWFLRLYFFGRVGEWGEEFSFPLTGMSSNKVSDCDVKNKTTKLN